MTERPISRPKSIGFTIASISIGILVAVLFCGLLGEIALRIYLLRTAESIDQLRETFTREAGGEFHLFSIVRPSADERRVYELIPGANGSFIGQPFRANSDGFRDKERTRAKPPGIFRIAVMGDSIAFGWGVKTEDRFSDVFENLLNAETSATTGGAQKYEVLNFAIPGYNTVMELATWEDKVLAYSPDLLILCLVNNDDELPNFVRDKPRVWSLNTLFIAQFIRDRAANLPIGDTARLVEGGIEPLERRHAHLSSGFNPELVPKEYQPLVGMENMEKALRKLHDDAASRKIPAVCVMYYPKLDAWVDDTTSAPAKTYNSEWFQIAKGAGYVICDPLPDLLEALRSQHKHEQSFWVKPGEDFHPNAPAHAILARKLRDVCREKGLLK